MNILAGMMLVIPCANCSESGWKNGHSRHVFELLGNQTLPQRLGGGEGGRVQLLQQML